MMLFVSIYIFKIYVDSEYKLVRGLTNKKRIFIVISKPLLLLLL